MCAGKLTFFCGKMGSGKSTRSRTIAQATGAVLLSEDDWLAALYPGDIVTLADYVERATRLRAPITALVQSLLRAGTPVVMDFPANTPQQRDGFRALYREIDAAHELVYVEASDAQCLAQIAVRRVAEPERAATDTPEMFAAVTRHFVPPQSDEGFNVTRVSAADAVPGARDGG